MIYQESVDLRSYTTFGIAGTARYLVEVQNTSEIQEALLWAQEHTLPYSILAGGSNTVFCHEEYPGLVIVLRNGKVKVEGTKLRADAATPLAEVVTVSLAQGLSGLESLTGIPGSVGGAVVGNAGAYGKSISEILHEVTVLCEDGSVRTLSAKECEFGYRDSIFKHCHMIVLSVTCVCTLGDSSALKNRSDEIRRLRGKKYPEGLRCPGSYFKNVLTAEVTEDALTRIDMTKVIDGKIPAGYLLETVGACGMREGGLSTASYHGNLIINDGTGTFADLERLTTLLKSRVRERFGIMLEEEVRLVV